MSGETIRATLATIAVRDTVPPDEQLSLLPFKVGELAGFRIGGIIPGRALMLTLAPCLRATSLIAWRAARSASISKSTVR